MKAADAASAKIIANGWAETPSSLGDGQRRGRRQHGSRRIGDEHVKNIEMQKRPLLTSRNS